MERLVERVLCARGTRVQFPCVAALSLALFSSCLLSYQNKLQRIMKKKLFDKVFVE